MDREVGCETGLNATCSSAFIYRPGCEEKVHSFHIYGDRPSQKGIMDDLISHVSDQHGRGQAACFKRMVVLNTPIIQFHDAGRAYAEKRGIPFLVIG